LTGHWRRLSELGAHCPILDGASEVSAKNSSLVAESKNRATDKPAQQP
jgi:hypothetical protein